MAIIAISRQMGSCGYPIAAAVAKVLNYDYVDRQMIVNAAEANVLEAAVAEAAERRLSAWQRFSVEKIRYRTFVDAAFGGARPSPATPMDGQSRRLSTSSTTHYPPYTPDLWPPMIQGRTGAMSARWSFRGARTPA